MSGRNLLAPKEQAEPKPGRNLFKPLNMSESLNEGIKTLVPEGKEDLEKYGYRPDLPWERQSRRFREYYEGQADRELQGRRALLGPFAENDTSENLTSRAKALAAKNNYKLPGRNTPEPKMGMGQAFVTGAADVGRLIPGGKQLVQSLGESAVGDPSLDYSKVLDASTTRALEDRPMATRGGQIATLLAPGAAITKGVTAAPRIAGALMSPAVAARLAGKSLFAQGVRYGGRGAVLGGAGVADYYLYNAAAEAGNVAKLEGQETPDLGQRLGYANSQVFTPGGAIAAASGPLLSGAYRTGRAAVAGTKNLATTGTLRRAIPQQGAKPQIVGTRSDLFTPTDVQGRVMAGGLKANQPSPQTGRTPTEEAYDLLLAKGFDPDKTEALVKLVSYDRYANVDEMLFELASMVDGAADVDQLAVALARVGGDSNRIFRQGFQARNAEMPDRIRVALRDALGLSGDDLEDFGRQMAAKAKEASSEGYTAAYGRQVSDESWAKIYQRLLDTTDGFSPNLTNDVPDGIAAARAGAREARATANGDKAQLDAARQLDELAGALAGRSPQAPKLSTHALDFLDRGFGSRIADATRGTQKSLIGLQKAIRQSGLDADTGLNIPRTIYSQHMAAQEALSWAAERAAKKAVSLRDLKNQFLAAKKRADDAFDEGIGEGRSVIDQSLVMGWLRGSEDLIEMADNPGSLIRQIYGSERQRQKLLEMMPNTAQGVTKPGGGRMTADEAGTGDLGDQTKRIRALVGGKRSDGKGAVESLFDRQRRMLENQGRVSGGSQTGNVNEAITAQGGLVRAADAIARAIMNPAEAARNAALWAVSNAPIFRPAIFKPEVNRELGRILATRGRDELIAVIGEIRARQIATGKGPKPPAGAAPAPPPPTGGGRGPRNAPGKSKLGTRAADATALGILATGGPTAEAETGDAETRIAELSQSQANAQQHITEYEQALKTFEAMAPKEKQAFLKNNGYTGPNGETINPDGDVRGLTGFAIQAYKNDLNGALAAQKAERESFRKQINQIRVGLAQRPEKQTNPLLDKITEYATYGALAYGAHRFRGAMIKGSQVSANRAAAKANALLTRLPVPPEPPRRTLYSRVPGLGNKDAARIKRETNAANKAQVATEERLAGRDIPPISANPTSPDGLPNRLANVDEFDRQRAAGDFGPVGRIGRLMEPVNSRLRGSDLAVIGTGAADTYITEGMIRETRADIAAEEKRLDAALKANNGEGDPDAIEVSSRRLEQLRQAETVQVILQRIGIGMMIGGGFGLTHGRYARPQPRFEAAARERDLINRAMAPPPPPPTNALAPTSAPRKPRAPGPQKPKPKPPVSFSGGRSRKAENDNDR